MQVDLNPAGGFLDALAGVVGTPAFNEAHPENTQPSKVVYPDTSRGWQAWEESGSEEGVEREEEAVYCFSFLIQEDKKLQSDKCATAFVVDTWHQMFHFPHLLS